MNAELAERRAGHDNQVPPDARAPQMVRGQLLELMRLPVLVAASLMLLALTLLVGVAWRGVSKLEPVAAHQELLRAMQDVIISTQQALLEVENHSQPAPERLLATVRDRIAELAAVGESRVSSTPNRLEQIRRVLSADAVPERTRLVSAMTALNRVLADEQEAHRRFLHEVGETARLELALAVSLALAIPAAGVAAGYLLRRRVWKPLGNLADLLNELSIRDYFEIPTSALETASPIVTPVLRNYNSLVARLRTLEAEHQRREHTLEQEVRAATAALLDLNRQLAASERLAAIGAVSAGLAHELRNPLAGIRMACRRLRDTVVDTQQAERLGLVVSELDRLTELLNSLLAQAHHAPEIATEIALAQTIDELLSLVRYQVSDRIRIECEVADDLYCTIPVGQLRQTLWNLVLNAAQAIGDNSGSIAICADADDSGIMLRVVDDGPGFSSEQLTAPARAFVTAREGGTGLGLAMVQRFARDLGGAVKLENCSPRGACVTLSLPCEFHRA